MGSGKEAARPGAGGRKRRQLQKSRNDESYSVVARLKGCKSAYGVRRWASWSAAAGGRALKSAAHTHVIFKKGRGRKAHFVWHGSAFRRVSLGFKQHCMTRMGETA